METHVVSEGQDIFDVVIQKFGTLENVFDFLTDNPTLDINSPLASGDRLQINNTNKGLVRQKQWFKNRTFIVVNADEQDLTTLPGDYNNDYNEDYLI